MTKTKYYGIYIMEANGAYWIVDDNGNDQCFCHVVPTETDIENYRNNL